MDRTEPFVLTHLKRSNYPGLDHFRAQSTYFKKDSLAQLVKRPELGSLKEVCDGADVSSIPGHGVGVGRKKAMPSVGVGGEARVRRNKL